MFSPVYRIIYKQFYGTVMIYDVSSPFLTIQAISAEWGISGTRQMNMNR